MSTKEQVELSKGLSEYLSGIEVSDAISALTLALSLKICQVSTLNQIAGELMVSRVVRDVAGYSKFLNSISPKEQANDLHGSDRF